MPNNPFLDPATTVSGVRTTPWPEVAPSNYTRPMHRGPGTPPHSNFRSPYAPRELLPYYVGFPSEYPHILPTETRHPYDLAFALVQPWLLPRPAPVAPPAPRRAGGGRPGIKDPGMKSAHTNRINDPGMLPSHTPPKQPVNWNDPIQVSHHRDVLTQPRPAQVDGIPIPEDVGMLTNPWVSDGMQADNMTALQLRQQGTEPRTAIPQGSPRSLSLPMIQPPSVLRDPGMASSRRTATYNDLLRQQRGY